MDLKDALWEDVLTVGRLVAVCFGNVSGPSNASLQLLCLCLYSSLLTNVSLAYPPPPLRSTV